MYICAQQKITSITVIFTVIKCLTHQRSQLLAMHCSANNTTLRCWSPQTSICKYIQLHYMAALWRAISSFLRLKAWATGRSLRSGSWYFLPFTQLENQSIYRVSQEESAILREGVPHVKIYRYNPKHLCPKLSGYGDNGQRKVWSSAGSTHCTYQLRSLSCCPCVRCSVTAHSSRKRSPFLCHV
jgi:hypothetical protein